MGAETYTRRRGRGRGAGRGGPRGPPRPAAPAAPPPVLLGAGIALFVLATPAYLLMRTGLTGTWIGGLALGIVLSAILGTYAVWSAEIFPTRTRQGGLSIAYNVTAALFAGTVPYLMTVLISATGSTLVPGPYLMAAAVIGLIAAFSLRETAGNPLLQAEDLAEERPES
ncbi:MFS transporter [Amycolatopsis sp. NPDC059019]|uniref:MFS transporter n=1 Tax=Amycolatopsis sp. NPDC059019 TaxID=3346702 RepID=UPI0036710930